MINLLVLLLITFNLHVGQVYDTTLVKCYDGDTCTINVDLGFNLWLNMVKVRLINIDTPEMRGVEKKDGILARDHLLTLLNEHEPILLKTDSQYDSFGRILGEFVYPCDQGLCSINEAMLSDGFAKPYED